MQNADLPTAYEGSYYTILGAGGDLPEWVAGYTRMLQAAGAGTPRHWFITTGKAINEFAATRGTVNDPFQDDLTCLMFPLDGMAGGILAMFKIQNGDRWFDDIVGNMADPFPSEEESDTDYFDEDEL